MALTLWRLAPAVTVLCMACAPPKNIGALGSAVEQAADGAAAALELVNDTAYEKCLAEAVAMPPLDMVVEKHYWPSDEDVTCKPVAEDQLGKRIAVIDALGSYARALQDLASTERDADVMDAAVDFHGSVAALNARHESLYGEPAIDTARMEVLTRSVYTVGAVVNRVKRRKAIREVVLAADAPIQSISKKLAGEFAADGELAKLTEVGVMHTRNMAQQFYNACEPLPVSEGGKAQSDAAGAEVAALAPHPHGAMPRCKRDAMTYSERVDHLRYLRDLKAQEESTLELFGKVSAAMAKVGSTHAAITDAVEDNDFSLDAESARAALVELETLSADVEELVSRLQ